jgi:hypothetical protein
MNAWLLTWEWTTTRPREKIVAILSSRRSDASIAELVELLVQRTLCGAHDLAYYANRRKKLICKAETPLIINSIPHGQRVLCGHGPWLYGRVVTDLKVMMDGATDEEVLTWQEPPQYRWAGSSMTAIELAAEGKVSCGAGQTNPSHAMYGSGSSLVRSRGHNIPHAGPHGARPSGLR